jgi:hypothetical protein
MTLMSSPITPQATADTNLANQIGSLQKSIDSLAAAYPGPAPPPAGNLPARGEPAVGGGVGFPHIATQASPSMADAGSQASPSMADAGTHASPSMADAGTQMEAHGRKRSRRLDVLDANPRPHKRARTEPNFGTP